jgi:serpin B
MQHRTRIIITFSLILVLAGCQSASVGGKLVQADLPRIQAPAVSENQLATLSEGHNTFAFDLYHTLTSDNKANLIYSPFSIWLAFSMVYAGAQGETEGQMADVFHFLDQDSQHVTLNALDQRLQSTEESKKTEEEGTPFQLKLANAVWSQEGYAFKQAYLDLLASQYGAGMRVVDFQRSAQAARQAINDWVDKNTDGKIKEIAGPGSVTPDTRLVLTNAILFKAGWLNKFDQASTADGPFTLLDGGQVTTPLMHGGGPLDYLKKEDYEAVRLPYVSYAADGLPWVGDQTEMWVILPAVGRFKAVQGELGPSMMSEIQQAGMAHVTLTMPSYEFESELSLIDLLIQMGLTQAFCPEGDYGGISEGGGLCIGQAVHKATIKVDEQGTEATAATLVAMPVSIMQEINMKVDRPFIFVIVDRESGIILFLGQVLNPAIH